MKSKSADKIKMPSIDELLGVSGEESATDIEISRIHSFANHPCTTSSIRIGLNRSGLNTKCFRKPV